jgi:hypothetical protein
MPKRVIIADSTYASQIESLRSLSYHNSKGFTVKDETELANYCRWGAKDEQGIVLLALNEHDEAVACLRANTFFDRDALEASNKVFAGYPDGFINYPVLDMTFAATSPAAYGGGFMSLLRYYMYRLHRHSVKSISGHVVRDSILHTQLAKLGYEFVITDYQPAHVENIDTSVLARLVIAQVETALTALRTKYAALIEEYPLIIQ